MNESEWRRFVALYHREHPGITERLLSLAETSPYGWLTDALRGIGGPVLDLACGSAPTREKLPDVDWVGVDLSAAELAEARRLGRGPLVTARADALPVGSGSVDAVCAAMCLPVLTPLPAVLAEVRRVLRPGGVLAALVPSGSGLSLSGALGWLRVMAALRAVRQPWPNPGARDGLGGVLSAAGFRVRSDERRVFPLVVESAGAAAVVVDALYLPGSTPRRSRAARRSLGRWAGPGRRLELPLRRVVAVLPSDPPRVGPDREGSS
ncbi:class I SAM-dependent methyltransferase [Streptomyces sp. ZYX-F-203]